jgi:hypothetical protein
LKWTPLRVHGSCYCGNPTGQTREVHVIVFAFLATSSF